MFKVKQQSADFYCVEHKLYIPYFIQYTTILFSSVKPGFHSNESLALRKRKPQETQAIAFEWKPGFS